MGELYQLTIDDWRSTITNRRLTDDQCIGEPIMTPPALLEFRNLTVYRDEHVVLDRFSLSIPAGQNVAILGPNGSGKSTVLKLITRELFPVVAPSAALRVLGRDRWLLFELREHLGIVTNDLMATCTREITGRDLVLSAFFGSVGLWPHHEVTAEMEHKADVALELMEVRHLAARTVNHLSSGESRRLLIARALAHQPAALVLDEPTNSLDMRACHDLTSCLRRLARQGTNIILVTHHLPDIIPEIDRVVALKDGRVFQDGPTGSVLTPAVLSQVFGVRVRVERMGGHYMAFADN
jgi:iron complex transport system ATP-binding protein